MKEALMTILQLQELDMNMIRLMELKKKRQEELKSIHGIRKELEHRLARKEHEVLELKKTIKLTEVQIREVQERTEKYEKQQSTVKKVDEFNALSQQITTTQRERASLELQNNERAEELLAEEEVLLSIRESLESTREGSKGAEREIINGVATINDEGKKLQVARSKLATTADRDVLAVYERLLHNKKDRVVVPIDNRACTGCHITITPQHENLVRKGERLVFCEHCSRIHYWPEEESTEEGEPRRRRRRRVASA